MKPIYATLRTSTPHRGRVFFVALALSSCTPKTSEPPPKEPTIPVETSVDAAPKSEESDPFDLRGELLSEEQLPLLDGPKPLVSDVPLAAAPKGVPAAPASCTKYVSRRPAAPLAPATCSDLATALPALAAALEHPSPDDVDAALAGLEACPFDPKTGKGLEPGLVRAVRVELAPPECGDVLAEPVLTKRPEGMSGSVQHALVGLALAARLHRTASSPPELAPPYPKKKVEEFVGKKLFPWFNDQAVAVQELSKQGAQLSSYGKGVVALASGWADLRMVDVLRDAPVPDDFRTDPEKGSVYFAALDEKLEPRKARGRDAALVGLREMAAQGVLSDARTTRTRSLLAKLYGGRRVDGLDVLLVPLGPPPSSSKPLAILARRLPTFYAGRLLEPGAALEPDVFASLTSRGVPTPIRASLRARTDLARDLVAAYAQFKLTMGVRYWRAVDFDEAVRLFGQLPAAERALGLDVSFATALALRRGPTDVAALMLQPEAIGPKFGDVRALDRFVDRARDKPEAGLAAFNAAVVRQIATPRDADAAYWLNLEKRYAAAKELLPEPARSEAHERAKAAAATAKVIQKTEP
jgi:hypothetical protein